MRKGDTVYGRGKEGSKDERLKEEQTERHTVVVYEERKRKARKNEQNA